MVGRKRQRVKNHNWGVEMGKKLWNGGEFYKYPAEKLMLDSGVGMCSCTGVVWGGWHGGTYKNKRRRRGVGWCKKQLKEK